MIGADILCDISKEFGYTPLSFIVHPKDWSVIVYTGEDYEGLPQWRVAYPEPPYLPDSKEAFMARAYERVPLFLNSSKNFKIIRGDPRSLHQQCAGQARREGYFSAATLCIRTTPSVASASAS